MSHDHIVRELKDKTCFQEEQIYKLREKLVTYDKVITEKEELQCELNDLKQWMQDVEFKEKQINADLMNNLDCQSKNLKKSEAAESQLRTEKNRLLDFNDRMTEQIKALTKNEQKLLNSIEELTISKKHLQCELTNANGKILEQNCCIEKLSKDLKCKEEESYELRRELDECKMAFNRLTETCKCQEKELECLKKELMEHKNKACQIEEKLKCERDTLCTELQIKCQRLREMEIEYEELRQNLSEEKANACKLGTQIEEMQYANEKERCEATAKIQKLKNENCIKDEGACRMKSQIADLLRENECKCAEINALKTKIQANECLLEKIKHSSEVFIQIMNNKVDQLERDKISLECDLKQKKRIICEMERESCRFKSSMSNSCQSDREVCCLRDKIKELESSKNPSPCCPISNCESSSSYAREKKCSSSCCSPSPECRCPRENKCNELDFCSPNRISKCLNLTPKTCNNDNRRKSVLSELKQLYCDLEQLKGTSKTLNI